MTFTHTVLSLLHKKSADIVYRNLRCRPEDIEAPLLFSTQALDISMEGICSLIRSYLSNRDIWRRDLLFAMPHDLCGMIKWALGRYVNPQGGRGFLVWETYERWRFGEREKVIRTTWLVVPLFESHVDFSDVSHLPFAESRIFLLAT